MQIEDLIKKRKNHLDLENPPDDLWQNIQKDWKKKPKYPIWKYAAILFIGVSTGLIFYASTLQRQVNQLTALSDISEDYQRLEQDYIKQINILEGELDLNKLSSNEQFEWLLSELKLLDEINKIFLKDLSTSAPEDRVVKAIIDYYEKKIRILNKIELEQKRSQYETSSTNDPIS